jgi:MFS family permease
MLSEAQDSGVNKMEEEQVVLSKARRYTLLALVSIPIGSISHADSPQFCSTQFVDVYNASAIVLATADVSSPLASLQHAYSHCQVAKGLNMGATEGVWTLSAYVLTFASFMLPVSSLIVYHSAVSLSSA